MAANGSTYIDVLPDMSRYFREARAELRANRVTGQIDVEVERASLQRAERALQQTADRAVAARNRQINATQAQARAERELTAMQTASNVTSERYADQVERVARAQREAAMAARSRQRAEQDLASGRADVATIRTRLDTGIAEQQSRTLIQRIEQRVATISARIDVDTEAYRRRIQAATRGITQNVRVVVDNRVTRVLATAVTQGLKFAGIMGTVGIAVGGLVGPIGAVVAGLTDALGVAALLPAAIGAAAAAFAAVKIGTAGIGDAFKALAKPAAGGGSGAAQAAQQLKAQVQAERQLTQAQKGAERAQADLNKERAAAVRRLRDMRLEVAQSGRDERGAIIELQRAKDDLAALGRDGEPVSLIDREAMQLDVENAEANLERIRVSRADLTADNEAAQAAGIEGDAGVVAAREQVASANDAVRDAQEALTEAMTAGAAAASGAADAGAEAMAKLSANAQDLVTKVRGIMPAWTDLKMGVQDALTGGMGDAIVTLADRQLPTLKAGLVGIAGEINTGVRAALAGLSSDRAVSDLNTLLGNTTKTTGNLSAAFAPFLEGFLSMAAIGSDYLPSLTSGFGGLGESFKEWAQDGDKVRAVIDKAFIALQQLGTLFGNVGSIISGVFQAGEESGGGLLNNLVLITGEISKFVNSVEGQAALQGFFSGVGQAISVILPIVGQLAGIVGGQIVPMIADLITAAGPGLSGFVTGIGALFAALAPSAGPIGEALGAVFAALGEAMVTLAPVVPQIADAFIAFVNAVVPMIPVFADLALMILPPLLNGFVALAPILPALVLSFMALNGIIAAARTAWLLYNGVMLAWRVATAIGTGIQWAFNAAMTANPIGLLVAALAVVVGALIYFFTQTELGQKIIQVAWDWIKTAAGWLWDKIKWVIEKIVAYFQWWWDMVVTVKDGVVAAFNAVLDFFRTVPEKIGAFFSNAWEWLKDAGKKIIEGFINGIKDKFNDVKDTLGDLTDKLTSWKGPEEKDRTLLVGAGQTIIEGFIKGLESRYGAVKSSLQGLTADIAATPMAAPTAPVLDAPTVDATKAGADPTGTADVMAAALGQVQTGAVALGSAFGSATNVAGSTWASLANGIALDKAALIDPAFGGVMAGLGNAGTAFVNAANLITPTWRNTGQGIENVRRGTIDPAMANTRDAVLFTADTFGVGAQRIGEKWNGIRPKVSEPVRFAINNVFNDGLVGMWNSVNSLLGTPTMPRYNIGSFASGTSRLPGYSPGHDNLHLSTPDGRVGISLGGGEGIARPEVVRAIGPDKFDGLNAAAKMGGTKGVQKYLGGYAEGGILDSMAAVVRSKFPGMSITSTYRAGDPGYHGRRQAMDFSNGTDSTAGMRAAAAYIADNYPQPITAQLIHQPFNRNIGQGQGFVGDGLGFYGSGTMAGHRNHVHWAANGPVPLIPGGPIDPSLYASADAMGSVDYTSVVAGMTKPYRDKINAAVGGYKTPGMIGGLPKAVSDKMVKAADAKIAAATAVLQSSSGGGVSMGPLGGNSMDYARQIVDAAKDRALGKEGARIGVATALVESGLRMYANRAVPASLSFPHDAVGSDHDSVGLFQQRQAGWGTLAQRMNAKASAGLFFNKLMTFNWRGMDPGAAAQRVQVSAFPGRYSQEMGRATGIVDSVFDRGGVASGQGYMLKDVIEPERVLDPAQTRLYDSLLPILESVNDSVAYASAGISDRDRAALETVGATGGGFVGQQIENQYVVDPQANARTVRRATKRALAGTTVVQ